MVTTAVVASLQAGMRVANKAKRARKSERIRSKWEVKLNDQDANSRRKESGKRVRSWCSSVLSNSSFRKDLSILSGGQVLVEEFKRGDSKNETYCLHISTAVASGYHLLLLAETF